MNGRAPITRHSPLVTAFMKPERWRQIEQRFHAALEREASQRAAFLNEVCVGDETLRREVESLLAYQDQAESFIEAPAFAVAPELLVETQTELSAGELLDHYRILRPIGAGGMGQVYLAQDTRLGRKVALKLLSARFTRDQDRVYRFQREARAASALNHPNILTIHDIGKIGETHFIATEFIDGQTLRRQMANGPMELPAALDIAVQVAYALAAAHAAGIIHRDIKPENIMLRPDGYIKILDFGIAKLTVTLAAMIDCAAPTISRSETRAGVVIGSPHYMSPEQARGLKVDGRTDLFSLGVVLYEMVTGRAPFEGATFSDVIVSILEKEPPPLGRYSPTATAALQRIVSRALHKDCEQRYQDAKELAHELKAHRQELEIEAEHGHSAGVGWGNRTSAEKGGVQTAVETLKGLPPQTAELREAPAAVPDRQSIAKITRRRLSAVTAVAALVMALLGVAYFARSHKAVDSIAVLPFVNEGGDPSAEYLWDGISEGVIYRLSPLPNLKVLAFSSVLGYKRQEVNLQVVGRELRVRGVLTGRIIQRGDDCLISAELVDVRDNSVLWGQQYHHRLADVSSASEEIARELSQRLGLKLSREERRRLTKRYTENTEADQLYQKGRYFWNKRNPEAIQTGIEYFKQAIEKDSNYALAYAGLADSYAAPSSGLSAREWMPKAKEAALRALEIDEALAEAHAALGYIRYRYDWDWFGAEKEFKRAIDLNPHYAPTHHWYSMLLASLGRQAEASAEIQHAQETEPLSLIVNADVGWQMYSRGQYDRAIEQLRKTLEMDQNFMVAHYYLGQIYERTGRHQEAVAEYLRWRALRGDSPETVSMLKRAYAISGLRGFLRQSLEFAKNRPKNEILQAYSIAALYARLGEKDQAFAWLERAYEDRDNGMVVLKADPRLEILRSDPRFADLLRRMGLAQ